MKIQNKVQNFEKRDVPLRVENLKMKCYIRPKDNGLQTICILLRSAIHLAGGWATSLLSDGHVSLYNLCVLLWETVFYDNSGKFS